MQQPKGGAAPWRRYWHPAWKVPSVVYRCCWPEKIASAVRLQHFLELLPWHRTTAVMSDLASTALFAIGHIKADDSGLTAKIQINSAEKEIHKKLCKRERRFFAIGFSWMKCENQQVETFVARKTSLSFLLPPLLRTMSKLTVWPGSMNA